MKASISTWTGIAAISLLSGIALPVHSLTFLTEENPPFNHRIAGKPAGTATEIVTEMAKRAGLSVDIKVLKWEEAYQQAQAQPNTCIYSIARLENRENQLQWVGELAQNKWAVFGKSDFARPVKSIADLRPLKIGGVVQDAKIEYLKSSAVTNIREVLRDEQNPPRLFLKREDPNYIDLWITSYYSGMETAKNAKAGPVKVVYVLREAPLWLACSPRTAKADITKLSGALAAMNKDGTRKRLIDAMEKSGGH